MKQKQILSAALVGSVLLGMGAGWAAMRLLPTASAAPLPTPTDSAALPVRPFAEMLTGKTYPITIKAEQFDSSYHLVGMVDAQGQASLYATRGETVTAGGETFLVCYTVSTTNVPNQPPRIKAGTIGILLFVNMRAIEAVGGIAPISLADNTATSAP